MKQPKRPFVVEITGSRARSRPKDHTSIWGKLDLASTAREIAGQDANGSPADETIPGETIARFDRKRS